MRVRIEKHLVRRERSLVNLRFVGDVSGLVKSDYEKVMRNAESDDGDTALVRELRSSRNINRTLRLSTNMGVPGIKGSPPT